MFGIYEVRAELASSQGLQRLPMQCLKCLRMCTQQWSASFHETGQTFRDNAFLSAGSTSPAR